MEKRPADLIRRTLFCKLFSLVPVWTALYTVSPEANAPLFTLSHLYLAGVLHISWHKFIHYAFLFLIVADA
jgi:hypothetical protein